MAAPVRPVQGTGQTGLTNALEVVPDRPIPISVMLSLVVPTFLIQLVTLDLSLVRLSTHRLNLA